MFRMRSFAALRHYMPSSRHTSGHWRERVKCAFIPVAFCAGKGASDELRLQAMAAECSEFEERRKQKQWLGDLAFEDPDHVRHIKRKVQWKKHDQVHWVWQLKRLLELCVLFSPALILSPVAYFSRTFRDAIWWRLVRFSINCAGTAAIKFAQWAATRPDLFSTEICDSLSILHDEVIPHSFEFTAESVEKELGQPISELFLEFEEEALASGAVGQVHRAKLLDGTDVVVKVMHPKAREQVSVDLCIMQNMMDFLSTWPEMEWLSLDQSMRDLAELMYSQLDLHVEEENLLAFSDSFADDPAVIFPEPVPGMVSPSVLVETFESGESIANFFNKEKSEFNVELASQVITMFLNMMIRDNFVHSDLHPGNIFVRKDPKTKKPRLVVLDCGLVTSLAGDDRDDFISLFTAIATGNGTLAADVLLGIPQGSHEFIDPEGFKRQMELFFEEIRSRPFREIEIGSYLQKMSVLRRKHHVLVDSNFANLYMAVIVLEGIGKQLDPDLSLLELAIPIFWSLKEGRKYLAKHTDFMLRSAQDKIDTVLRDIYDLFS